MGHLWQRKCPGSRRGGGSLGYFDWRGSSENTDPGIDTRREEESWTRWQGEGEAKRDQLRRLEGEWARGSMVLCWH